MSEAYESVQRALSLLVLARQALMIPLGASEERMDTAMNTSYGYMATVTDILHEVLDILEELE